MRELFSEKGQITDVQLKYKKDGAFRQFAFIGYESEDQASSAVEYFNNTCVQTNRIKVELCSVLGADKKPTTSENTPNAESEEKDELKKKNKNDRIAEIIGEHKNDPAFVEYMKLHAKGNGIWDNDLGLNEFSATATEPNDEPNEALAETEPIKLANADISDSEYLKQLTSKSSTSAKVVGAKNPNELFTIKIRGIPFKTKRKDVLSFFRPLKPFSIRLPSKIHGFCYVGFKSEREFKKAMLKDHSFLGGKQVQLADFTDKNRESTFGETGPKQIEATNKNATTKSTKWQKQEDAIKNEEDISESGKIFFRNLAYTVNDDQIQTLFEKYGPVVECNLPIDPITRKIKGFGTVTYVMPEHAVRAFSELDGTDFHGRLLHLIPGKNKDDDLSNVDTDGMSFKQKKEIELKKTASSSHNWNTLFMGTDAVASSLAKNYNTTKEAVLDTAGGGSGAAVRLALGETELIIQMRKFLEENDVVLDAFAQAPLKRSKTVLLVKNLPANTTIEELQPIFSKFGLLGRLVLPPSGVTALVEYLDPSEAKKAFKKLAYTKFKNLPLYLEWAPENAFKSVATRPMASKVDNESQKMASTSVGRNDSNPFKRAEIGKKQSTEEPESFVLNEPSTNEKSESREVEAAEQDDSPPESGTTLFLRNLNFSTRDEAVRNHFKHIGRIHHVQVAMKKDPDNVRNRISLGYGFIQFKLKKDAEKALKTMQVTNIEGNSVELKRSDRLLRWDRISIKTRT